MTVMMMTMPDDGDDDYGDGDDGGDDYGNGDDGADNGDSDDGNDDYGDSHHDGGETMTMVMMTIIVVIATG